MSKWFSTALIIAAFIVTLSVYSLFKGIPFGGIIAEHQVERYVTAVYGETQINAKAYYNFKSNSYTLEIAGTDGHLTETYRYDPYRNLIFDEALNETIGTRFDSDYLKAVAQFDEPLEFPKAIIYTSVRGTGNYTADTDKLPVVQKLYVLGIVNSNVDIATEESVEKPAEITRTIIDSLGEGYNITSVQVIYTDINGVYEITSDSSTAEKLLDSLKSKTHSIERIGEEEAKIIQALRDSKAGNNESPH